MAQHSEFDDSPEPQRPAAKPQPVVIQLQDHKAPGGGPRANKQVKWIALSETNEEYAEHQIKVRIRYPEAINAEYFNPGSPGAIIDGLRLIVLEHNGWVDPDTETVLPPVDQKCTIDAARDKALEAEEVTYAVALKEARTDAARSVVDAAHTRAVQKIEQDAKRHKVDQTEMCCFWDHISQEEIILMIRAANTARGKVLTFLLETSKD